MPIATPSDVSVDGHLVDGAIGHLTIATGVAFAALVSVLAITLIFHRARGGRRQAYYTHGHRVRDQLLAFAVALTMFVAVDATLAVRASGQLANRFWRYPDNDPNAVRVEVVARQWSWTFRLAGPDGRFATADDIVTLNELAVPVGRPIYVKLRSRDVVHSLYLPNFRTKIDVIPGSTTRIWFQAREAGRYEIGCAQHCGVGHYKMRAVLVARPEAEHRAWLERAEIDSRLRHDPAIDPRAAGEAWDWESGR